MDRHCYHRYDYSIPRDVKSSSFVASSHSIAAFQAVCTKENSLSGVCSGRDHKKVGANISILVLSILVDQPRSAHRAPLSLCSLRSFLHCHRHGVNVLYLSEVDVGRRWHARDPKLRVPPMATGFILKILHATKG